MEEQTQRVGVDNMVLAIQKGMLDTHLERIATAIRQRQRRVAHLQIMELEPGDRVRIKDLGMGAKYLNGLVAVIVKVNMTTAWIRLTPESREQIRGKRFDTSGGIKIPLTNIVPDNIHDGVAQQPLKHLEDLIPDSEG